MGTLKGDRNNSKKKEGGKINIATGREKKINKYKNKKTKK